MVKLSKLGEALKLGEQIRSLADALFDSYIKIGKTRRTLRDERKRDDLEFALDEIRWRLYGRYSLIHDVEDFVSNPTAKRAKFLKKKLKDRVSYLRSFNDSTTPLLYHASPSMAGDLNMITIKSMELYDLLRNLPGDEFTDHLAKAVLVLQAIADHLENVSDKIQEHMNDGSVRNP